VITLPQVRHIFVWSLSLILKRRRTLPSRNQIHIRSIDRISAQMTEQTRQQLIRMAWEDRTTFDAIKEKTGFSEADVIVVMRRELKPSSFRMWRKRVSGRITKHQKLLRTATQLAKRGRVVLEDPTEEASEGTSMQ
jgi:uncharacterized protein (TIGR03643 family)